MLYHESYSLPIRRYALGLVVHLDLAYRELTVELNLGRKTHTFTIGLVN